jgi:hypothetical protein
LDLRENAAEVWREIHNKELHNLHSLPYIIKMFISRRMGVASHVRHMEQMRNAYISIGRIDMGDTLEDNIKTDVTGTGCEGVNCTGRNQDIVRWRDFMKAAVKFRFL